MSAWEGPRPPEVRLWFDDVPVTLAALTFLRDTRIGGIFTQAPWRKWEEDFGREVDRDRSAGRTRPRNAPLLLSFLFVLPFSFFIYSAAFPLLVLLVRRRPYFGR